jgi:hypothetical protein
MIAAWDTSESGRGRDEGVGRFAAAEMGSISATGFREAYGMCGRFAAAEMGSIPATVAKLITNVGRDCGNKL